MPPCAFKDDGALWVIGSYHNIFRLGRLLQDLGYWILNDVVWRKSNPMPNFRGRRFTNAHETLIWAAKSEASKYTFNYDAMKALNEGVQMRSDWYMPICTGSERLKDQAGQKAHPHKSLRTCWPGSFLSSDQTRRYHFGSVFRNRHDRAVIRRLGRHYIGIEQNKDYAKLAAEQIGAVQPIVDDVILSTPEKRAQPRVPFGALVEGGWLAAGDTLFDKTKSVRARVCADGSLVTDKAQKGSIHGLGQR